MSSRKYGTIAATGDGLSASADALVQGISWSRIVAAVCVLAAAAFVGVNAFSGGKAISTSNTATTSLATDEESTRFNEFKQKFGKTYDTPEEEDNRFNIFRKNLQIVRTSEQSSGVVYGLNQYSDLTKREFKSSVVSVQSRFAGHLRHHLPGEVPDFNEHDCPACSRFPDFGNFNLENLPESFDWRDYGAVTEVKNQGNCASSWAFSAVGDVEGVWFLAGNDLTSLSTQQLVACNTRFNAGCRGGYPELAYMYMQNYGGLVSDSNLPYKAVNMYQHKVDRPFCDTTIVRENNFIAHIDFWQRIDEDEDMIALALIKAGPLSATINSSGMRFYVGGIDDPKDCSSKNVDQSVLIVGFGVEDGKKYWIIKNSWSAAWGEGGYYRLTRGIDACGIADHVTHAVIQQ